MIYLPFGTWSQTHPKVSQSSQVNNQNYSSQSAERSLHYVVNSPLP